MLVSHIDTEVLLDRDGLVRLTLGSTLEAFDTYFDNGSCTMTWIRLPQAALPSQRAELGKTGRIGTGNLADDLALHRARVAELVATGLTPLRMEGVDDYLELARHYVLRELPLTMAARYVFRLLCFVAIGGMVVAGILLAITR
jgi:hypothetical protein